MTEQGQQEESVDIHRFYEPQVQKYEMKYKMWCQVLKHIHGEIKRVSSPKGLAPELTPNVTALGDTFTLKDKERNRGNHMWKLLTDIPPEKED